MVKPTVLQVENNSKHTSIDITLKNCIFRSLLMRKPALILRIPCPRDLIHYSILVFTTISLLCSVDSPPITYLLV